MFAFWDLNSRQCVDCCFNTLPKNNNQQLSKGNPLFLLLQKNNTKKKLKNKPDKTQGSTSHVEDKNHILYLLKLNTGALREYKFPFTRNKYKYSSIRNNLTSQMFISGAIL